jgi:DNA-binding GntR family transcriptional regulator
MLSIDPLSEDGLNTAIYAELRARMVTGRVAPGQELSTRQLAAELGVSQTPVRDALSRLAADGAVAIRSKRRILVPAMTPERFDDLHRCRQLLEPDAAAHALPHLSVTQVAQLGQIDAALDRAIADRDAESYMRNNHAFHFTLYRAQPGHTQTQLIETLWLQFGPFMRVVFDRMMDANLNDHHQLALAAIRRRDAQGLREAIAGDIDDGMALIARAGFAAPGAGASA